MSGQPTRLTPEAQSAALLVARAGASMKVIAGAVGVSRSTLANWLKWGSEDFAPREGEYFPNDRKPYTEFAIAFGKARAIPIILCESTWLRAVENGDARAAASWLKFHAGHIYREDAVDEVGASPLGDHQAALDEWAASIRELRDTAVAQRESLPPTTATLDDTRE